MIHLRDGREKYTKWFTIFSTLCYPGNSMGLKRKPGMQDSFPFQKGFKEPGTLLEVGKKLKSPERQIKNAESILFMSICSILQITSIRCVAENN